jgi:hypothetical protein
MSNYNLHFRGQMEDEEVMAFSRKHWAVLIPNVIPLVILFAGIFLLILTLNQFTLPRSTELLFQLLIFVAITGGGYVIHRFFLQMINFFSTVIIVTNLRVVEITKTLFVKDIKESIDIKKIQDVDFKLEGLIKNILKFGDLNITLGNSEVKTVTQLPNPDFHFRLINRLKNEFFTRTQRSVDTGAVNGSTSPDSAPSAVDPASHLMHFIPTQEFINSEE